VDPPCSHQNPATPLTTRREDKCVGEVGWGEEGADGRGTSKLPGKMGVRRDGTQYL